MPRITQKSSYPRMLAVTDQGFVGGCRIISKKGEDAYLVRFDDGLSAVVRKGLLFPATIQAAHHMADEIDKVRAYLREKRESPPASAPTVNAPGPGNPDFPLVKTLTGAARLRVDHNDWLKGIRDKSFAPQDYPALTAILAPSAQECAFDAAHLGNCFWMADVRSQAGSRRIVKTIFVKKSNTPTKMTLRPVYPMNIAKYAAKHPESFWKVPTAGTVPVSARLFAALWSAGFSNSDCIVENWYYTDGVDHLKKEGMWEVSDFFDGLQEFEPQLCSLIKMRWNNV